MNWETICADSNLKDLPYKVELNARGQIILSPANRPRRLGSLVTLDLGLGMAEHSSLNYHGFFRVAHMGHVNAHMTLGMLGVIDAGLIALNIPHGAGAIEAASRVVREAQG